MSDEFDKDTLDNQPNNEDDQPENSDSENKSARPVILEELTEETNPNISLETIHKLGNVELPVRVVFANVTKTFEEVLAMCEGDIVKLNRFAGEPVDIFVGERVLAKGEITVVDDCFGVRIVDILPSGERLGPSSLE